MHKAKSRRNRPPKRVLAPRRLRDHAMVAMLIGRGLRRAELLGLNSESIEQREEPWVIADLVGKGGHVRTVPIPTWVKSAVDAWTAAAAIPHGPVFRASTRLVGCGDTGCRRRCSGTSSAPRRLTPDRQAGPARSAAHLRASLPSRRR
jgi:integrase